MKKLLLIFIFFLLLCNNAKCQTIETFIKEEVAFNKQFDVVSVLVGKKLSSKELLETYNDQVQEKFRLRTKRRSTFNQEDANRLIKETKNDTLVKYWTEKERIVFGFDEIINNYDKTTSLELYKKNDGLVNFYILSDPMYTNNGTNLIFLLRKVGVWTGYSPLSTEYAAIILKKENGVWVFCERINTTKKHY